MNGSTKKPQKKEVFESTETAAEMSPLSHFEVVDKGEQCKTWLLSALADRFLTHKRNSLNTVNTSAKGDPSAYAHPQLP